MNVDCAGVSAAWDGFPGGVERGEWEELQVRLADYHEVVADGLDGQQEVRLREKKRRVSISVHWRELYEDTHNGRGVYVVRVQHGVCSR